MTKGMPEKRMPSPFWRPAGSVGCLCLRVLQLVLAVAVLAIMASSKGELTSDGRPWYLALVALCQCVWSLQMAIVDAQLLLASRPCQYRRWASLVTVFDGITAAAVLITASGSLGYASGASEYRGQAWPNGVRYKSVVALAFTSFAALGTSFFINMLNLEPQV